MKAMYRQAWWIAGVAVISLAAWSASRGAASQAAAPGVGVPGAVQQPKPVASAVVAPPAAAPSVAAPQSRLDRDPLLEAASDPFQPSNFLPPAPVIVAAPPPPPPPPPKPTAPVFPYRFFGRVAGVDGVMVTYLSRDDALVPIRVGQVLETVYRVDGMDDRQISMTYLPLNEQFSLSAPAAQL